MDIAFEILLQPVFPPMSWRSSSNGCACSCASSARNANFLLSERFNRAVYGEPSGGQRVGDGAVSRRGSPRMGCAQWHRERYAPQNAILGIAGDVRAKDLIAKLEKLFAGWKKTELKPTWPRNPAGCRRAQSISRPPA